MDNAIVVIRQLIELCRRYDPDFDQPRSYEPFRLSLDCVPEAELDIIAREFGANISRPVNFAVGYESCPTVQPYAHVRIGSLSLSLCSKLRKATAAEIDAEVAGIKEKIATCCAASPPDFQQSAT